MRNTVQKILQHDKCFTLQGEGLPKGSEKMLQRERFFLGEGIQPLRVFAVFAFGFSYFECIISTPSSLIIALPATRLKNNLHNNN